MKLLIIKFCLIFSLLIQIKTELCNQVINPTEKKCHAADVTSYYYKCCYYEGRIDLVSKAEKILMALSALGDVSYSYTKERVISFCTPITKENYDDIDAYIENNKEIYAGDESIAFDSVSIDCYGKFIHINLLILILFFIF